MNHLIDLNPNQKEAATYKDGALLILAGAGAGKTKTITHRILHLITEGIRGDQILAITFTNKAAKEMRERVEKSIRDFNLADGGIPFLSTFHSLCVYILRQESRLLNVTKHFSILDQADATSLMKEAVKLLDLDPKQHEPRKYMNIISRKKNDFISGIEFLNDAKTYQERIIARVWSEYEKLKKKENAFDFDDLLIETVLLFKKFPETLEHYQNRWKYIHVDEYQDTNEVQYQLAKMLANKYKNICVVGDGDQNIYGWRGADIKNILNFEEDYPNAKVVLLEENYRSTKNILEAANEVIKKNVFRKDKNLFTKNKEGDKITLFEAYDEVQEATAIAETIDDLLRDENISPENMAILYRANFQSRVIEEALLMKNIPYQVLGVKFFERKEIKDVLSYVRASLNRESLSDIKRIINSPARGIGKATLAKIFAEDTTSLPANMQIKIQKFYQALEDINEYAKTNTPSNVIKFLIDKTGIEKELKGGTEEEIERLENIRELVTLSLKYDVLPLEEGLEKLLEDASLASDQDTLSTGEIKKGVRLMTVHASKGLEFDRVFICGLEQDLFPHKRMGTTQKAEDSEEERRLFYVALTRAKEKLFLSWASIRTIFGSRQINAPSEFLYDIPDDLIEREYARNMKTIYLD